MRSALLFLSVIANGYFLSTEKVLSIYTPSQILYVDVDKNQITFEGIADTVNFDSFEDMNYWVEDYTANSSAPSGYDNDLQWMSENGYITAQVEPCIAPNGDLISPVGTVKLYYNGANWAHNAMQDTSFMMVDFPNVAAFDAEYDECLECTYTVYVASKN